MEKISTLAGLPDWFNVEGRQMKLVRCDFENGSLILGGRTTGCHIQCIAENTWEVSIVVIPKPSAIDVSQIRNARVTSCEPIRYNIPDAWRDQDVLEAFLPEQDLRGVNQPGNIDGKEKFFRDGDFLAIPQKGTGRFCFGELTASIFLTEGIKISVKELLQTRSLYSAKRRALES